MDTTPWSARLERLQAAIDGLRLLLDERDESAQLTAAERKSLERAFDAYLTAGELVADHIEELMRRATPRPRR